MTKNLEELTSNWQDEKLDDGLYYIRLENGKTPIAELETWCRYDDEVEEPYKTEQEFFGYPKDIISEVLSPIPSYDHFVELKKKAEIDRLKKALKFYAKGRNYKKYLVSLPTGISGMNYIKCFVTLKDRGEIAQKP